jgi:hypothetical protein
MRKLIFIIMALFIPEMIQLWQHKIAVFLDKCRTYCLTVVGILDKIKRLQIFDQDKEKQVL